MKQYVLAQCYANLDVYFNVDDDFPAAVRHATFVVDTTDDRPESPGKNRRYPYTEYERAFMEAKCRVLERKGMIADAKSEWCAGVQLVP